MYDPWWLRGGPSSQSSPVGRRGKTSRPHPSCPPAGCAMVSHWRGVDPAFAWMTVRGGCDWDWTGSGQCAGEGGPRAAEGTGGPGRNPLKVELGSGRRGGRGPGGGHRAEPLLQTLPCNFRMASSVPRRPAMRKFFKSTLRSASSQLKRRQAALGAPTRGSLPREFPPAPAALFQASRGSGMRLGRRQWADFAWGHGRGRERAWGRGGWRGWRPEGNGRFANRPYGDLCVAGVTDREGGGLR